MKFYSEQKRANVEIQRLFKDFLQDAEKNALDSDFILYELTLKFEVSEKFIQKRINLVCQIYRDFLEYDGKKIKKVSNE